ncbi:conserved hypothetical protein [Candidatus Terasakiella magnetica]|nr:conserved hypothetical protein [Candidatus Terasakiella magnetica]
MKETGKALMRRLRHPDFTTRYFVGLGLDICGGADPLTQYAEMLPAVKTVRSWNLVEGDPQFLAGIADSTFDFVHATAVLQTVAAPKEALKHWLRVLKPGGHLILLVPDEDLYEQGMWPSTFNHDNRWTFTVFKTKSWSPVSLNVVELAQTLGAQADLRRLEVISDGFRPSLPRFDQTLTPIAESAIEVVIRKRPQAEAVAGGRLPPLTRALTSKDVFILTGLRVEPS